MWWPHNPAAPTLLVNKVGGIYQLGRSLMRVTFVLQEMEFGGATKCVEKCSLLWEPAALFEAEHSINSALTEYQQGTFEITDGGRRILAQ
jgi:hypothetical protein